jgi:hypothetical protein
MGERGGRGREGRPGSAAAKAQAWVVAAVYPRTRA